MTIFFPVNLVLGEHHEVSLETLQLEHLQDLSKYFPSLLQISSHLYRLFGSIFFFSLLVDQSGESQEYRLKRMILEQVHVELPPVLACGLLDQLHQLGPVLGAEGHVLDQRQVVVEGGEGPPGGADGDVGEGDLGDGEDLHRGGDGALLPASEGLLDEVGGADEAGQDNGEPEELEQSPGGGDVGQAVYGGGGEEGVEFFQHVVRLEGLYLSLTDLLCNTQ